MNNKKVIGVAIAGIMAVSLFTTAFATSRDKSAANQISTETRKNVCGTNGSSFMRDADGNFVSVEQYEKNIDQAIKDGIIKSSDKDAYMKIYGYCATNDGTCTTENQACTSAEQQAGCVTGGCSGVSRCGR